MKLVVVMIIVVMVVGEWVILVSEFCVKELCIEVIIGGLLFFFDKFVWVKDGDVFVSIG